MTDIKERWLKKLSGSERFISICGSTSYRRWAIWASIKLRMLSIGVLVNLYNKFGVIFVHLKTRKSRSIFNCEEQKADAYAYKKTRSHESKRKSRDIILMTARRQ